MEPGKATIRYTIPMPKDSQIGDSDAEELPLRSPVLSSVTYGGARRDGGAPPGAGRRRPWTGPAPARRRSRGDPAPPSAATPRSAPPRQAA